MILPCDTPQMTLAFEGEGFLQAAGLHLQSQDQCTPLFAVFEMEYMIIQFIINNCTGTQWISWRAGPWFGVAWLAIKWFMVCV